MTNEELALLITGDATGGKQAVQQVVQALENLATAERELKPTVDTTTTALQRQEQQIQKVGQSISASTGWYKQLEDALVRNKTVTDQTTGAQKDLFESVTRGGQGWSSYGQSAADAWKMLRSMSFSDIRGGINDIAASAGMTTSSLGALGTAGAVMGAAYAGWNVGRMIADFFDLDRKIGNATAKLLGFGDVVKEEAGAKQDSINLAIARGAKEIANLTSKTDQYTAAIKFNDQWVKNQIAGFKELGDTAARKNAPLEFAKQLRDWHEEIRKVKDDGALGSLKAALDGHVISVKELSASYRISEGAINLYRRELDEDAKAEKAAADEAKKHAAEQKRLEDAARRATEALQAQFDHLQHLELGHAAAAMTANQITRNLHGLSMELPKSDWQKNAEALERWQMNAAKGADTAREMLENLRGLGAQLPKITQGLTVGQSFTAAGMVSLQTAPAMIIQSMLHGGGMSGAVKGIGSGFGAQFGKGIEDSILKSLTKDGGVVSPLMKGLTGAIPVVGALLGPALDLLMHVGGPSQKELEGRDVVKQFEQQQGGWQGIQKALLGTGMAADQVNAKIEAMWAAEKQGGDAAKASIESITEALNAQKQKEADVAAGVQGIIAKGQAFGHGFPADVRTSIKALMDMKGVTDAEKTALQGLLDSNKPKMADLASQAEGFGITLEGLGPKFQQANIDERTKKIVDFLTDAKEAGGDVGGMLSGLSDEISALVNDSKKFGSAIPENMKPFIEELARAGRLTDENGDKIEDVTGLTFKDTPIDKSLTDLNDTIRDLINLLSGNDGVTAAIGDVGQAVKDKIPKNPFADWKTPDLSFGDMPFVPMASGGIGRVARPTLFYSAGNEDFAFSGEGKRFGGGGESSGPTFTGDMKVEINVPNVRDAQGFSRELDDMLRDDTGFIRTKFHAIIDSRIRQAAR